ncbi:MAG: metal ABC transporter solute-binding protein, Zn/Mn family [Acidimicrobiales bacterium]
MRGPGRARLRGRLSAAGAALVLALLAGGCSAGSPRAAAGGAARSGVVSAVGAENQYANVLSQIGGRYVRAAAILSNPNTDPHTFESSPAVAEEVSSAEIIVQNGAGYDGFMNKIESASSSGRRIIVVQRLLGLPDDTPNPHLWYDPRAMPAAARAMADDLSALLPGHAAYFRANLAAFDASLQPWDQAMAAFRADHPAVAAATTEPVADYLLQAMGMDNLTPFRFQADIMNGVDPSPQDVSLENDLLRGHQVKVFCYNQQVVDALTSSMRATAVRDGVPVVAVYETMPTPGYTYQSWMLAEVAAIRKAVSDHTSTEHL